MIRDLSTLFLILSVLVSLLPWAVSAEEAMTKEKKLSLLKIQDARLGLEHAKEALESYMVEFENAQRLYREDVLTLQEFNKIRKGYEKAELDYKQSQIDLERTELDLLQDVSNITIVEANKYKSLKGGKRMVDIVLKNTSNADWAEVLGEDKLDDLLGIQNVIVSIRDGAIAGEPYEVIIPTIALHEKKKITFRLLKDSDQLDVVMSFLESERIYSVVLKKGSLDDVPTISSSQFSQEGEIDSRISYGIVLERLSEDEKSFRLVVLNLPRQIEHSFFDPETRASLSQVRFTEQTSKIILNLVLAIHENLDRDLIDKTSTFYVLVTQTSELAKINELKDKYGEDTIPEEQIERLKGDKVKLELIPRGVGELVVVISNRYQEIGTDQTELSLKVEIHNRGTLGVGNVKLAPDLPYEWYYEIEPDLIKIIDPDDKIPVTLKILPPPDIGVGDYTVGVEAQGEVGNVKVESVKKNITIRVGSEASLAGSLTLVGVLILMLVGMVVAIRRVSRR